MGKLDDDSTENFLKNFRYIYSPKISILLINNCYFLFYYNCIFDWSASFIISIKTYDQMAFDSQLRKSSSSKTSPLPLQCNPELTPWYQEFEWWKPFKIALFSTWMEIALFSKLAHFNCSLLIEISQSCVVFLQGYIYIYTYIYLKENTK